jgi:hypothetical protein
VGNAKSPEAEVAFRRVGRRAQTYLGAANAHAEIEYRAVTAYAETVAESSGIRVLVSPMISNAKNVPVDCSGSGLMSLDLRHIASLIKLKI